jgi:hypothetical protein
VNVYLLNDSNIPLPNPMPPLAPAYMVGIRKLERRAHLPEDRERTVLIDGARVTEIQKALTDAERAELDVYKQRVRDSIPPFVGDDIWYRFSPKGQPGCVAEMPEGHANIIMKANPGRYRVVEYEEAMSVCPGHRPLRYVERQVHHVTEPEHVRHARARALAMQVMADNTIIMPGGGVTGVTTHEAVRAYKAERESQD